QQSSVHASRFLASSGSNARASVTQFTRSLAGHKAALPDRHWEPIRQAIPESIAESAPFLADRLQRRMMGATGQRPRRNDRGGILASHPFGDPRAGGGGRLGMDAAPAGPETRRRPSRSRDPHADRAGRAPARLAGARRSAATRPRR